MADNSNLEKVYHPYRKTAYNKTLNKFYYKRGPIVDKKSISISLGKTTLVVKVFKEEGQLSKTSKLYYY